MCENSLVIKNVREARGIIKELTSVVRSKGIENQELENNVNEYSNYNSLIESRIAKFNDQLNKANSLRKWY